MCACFGKQLLLVKRDSGETTVLLGHAAAATASAFCPHNLTMLVSVSGCLSSLPCSPSEDRTFIVWDWTSAAITYRSFILSSSPLICIATDPVFERIAIGDGAGSVHLVDLARGDFRVLFTQDLSSRASGAPISLTGASEVPTSPARRDTLDSAAAGLVEHGSAVLGLTLVCASGPPASSIAPAAAGLSAAAPAAGCAAAAPPARLALFAQPSRTLASLSHVVVLVAFTAGAVFAIDTHAHRIVARTALPPSPTLPTSSTFVATALVSGGGLSELTKGLLPQARAGRGVCVLRARSCHCINIPPCIRKRALAARCCPHCHAPRRANLVARCW